MFIPAIGLAWRPRPALCARQPFALITRLPLPYSRHRRLGCSRVLRLLCMPPCPLPFVTTPPAKKRRPNIYTHTHAYSPCFHTPHTKQLLASVSGHMFMRSRCKPALLCRAAEVTGGTRDAAGRGVERGRDSRVKRGAAQPITTAAGQNTQPSASLATWHHKLSLGPPDHSSSLSNEILVAFCEWSTSLKCAPYSLLSFFLTAREGGQRGAGKRRSGGQARVRRSGAGSLTFGTSLKCN